MPAPRTIHTVHVTLQGSDPEIWRLIEVDADMPLDRFHRVLQAAFGWTNSHMHQFSPLVPGTGPQTGPELQVSETRALPAPPPGTQPPAVQEAGSPGRSWQMPESLAEGMSGADERDETVYGAMALSGGALRYEYDFGDGWDHEVQLVSTRTATEDEPEAAVLDGALAAPLEGSGGVHGWSDLLEIHRGGGLNDPDRAAKAAWLAAHEGYWTPFDPEHFDVGEAGAAVRFELSGPDARTVDFAVPAGAGGRPARSLLPHAAPSVAASWLATLPPYPAARFAAAHHRAGLDPLAPGTTPALPAGLEPALEPFRRLVEACAAPGLPMTEAGYLTPAALRGLIEELGWEDEDMVAFGGKRERDVLSVLNFRKAAAGVGLVRRTGKRLVATATGRRAAQSGDALWAQLAGRAMGGLRHEGVRDATMLHALAMAAPRRPTSALARRAVNEGLDLLGYAYNGGERIQPTDFVRLSERWSGLMRGLEVQRVGKRPEPWQVRVEVEFARAALACPSS